VAAQIDSILPTRPARHQPAIRLRAPPNRAADAGIPKQMKPALKTN
jgi:hypothetical protein